MSNGRKCKRRMRLNEHMLPRTVVPRHYRIMQAPDLETFLFDGSEEIDIDVREPVSSFSLHARDLMITKAWVVDGKGTRLDAMITDGSVTWFKQVTDPETDTSTFEPYTKEFKSAATLDEENQRATFNFAGTLGVGHWKLFAEFSGSMVQPNFEGLYVCDYEGEDGGIKWMATTQYEATHARRNYPCFDEPALKAPCDFTLVVDENLVVLSNGRERPGEIVAGSRRSEYPPLQPGQIDEDLVPVEIPGTGKQSVSFATTPKQSTYLGALAIGDFECSESVWVNGKEIRIWTVKGKKHLTSYALKCAAYGVKWFERKFRVPFFGGDKVDLIAIPKFRSGAMENTGLITFRATALLVDELKATVAELQRVAEVVLHELAHQWCGNLVTMVWWDGLPLNESNATIFAYLVMNDFEPEWNIFNAFGIDRSSAFALDSLNSTHACWAPVGSPDEIEQRFDAITYEKGGSLEYQIMQYVGLARFLDGMHIYLTRFALDNAEVTDLWDAIEEGVRQGGLDVPVRQIMDAWFLNVGHPLVTVSESDKPGFIKLQQERFLLLADGADSEEDQLWPIPVHIRYATADGAVEEEKLIFSGGDQEVFIDKGFRWVVVNAGGSGFYRVRYSQALLDAIIDKPFDTLEVIERFNLVNDAWAMVRAQQISSDIYLGLLRKFAAERDPNVWQIIGGSLSVLSGLVSGHDRLGFNAQPTYYLTLGPRPEATGFKSFVSELVKPVFDELGWTPRQGESSATLELRGVLAQLLGTVAEDSEIQLKAASLFEAWKADRSSVDANVVPALISILAYTGGQARFDEFVALAKNAPTDQEKLRFLSALGKFRQPELYKAAIVMMLAEVKTDDAPYLLGAYLANQRSGRATWDFIRDNWQSIQDKFPKSGIVRMIGWCSSLDTPELQTQVVEFFATNKVEQGDLAVAQMLERLAINVRLRQTEVARLAAYFSAAPQN